MKAKGEGSSSQAFNIRSKLKDLESSITDVIKDIIGKTFFLFADFFC